MFLVTDSDKLRDKKGWRNKQRVFRVSLECPPQRESCIPSIYSFYCVNRLREAQRINHKVSEWAVWPLTPRLRKDPALCPDVISKSLPPRLSTPLPSHPNSHCRAAIGQAPWPQHLNHSVDLTLARCCFAFPAPTFKSVYCFSVSILTALSSGEGTRWCK